MRTDARIRAASTAAPYSDRTTADERVALAGLAVVLLTMAVAVVAVAVMVLVVLS